MGAYNGSGTFVRTYDWTTDEGNGINIEASRMDTEDDGFATGLSTCITKDGQTTVTANIPMNSKKFTGLTAGSARTDSISLGQVQDGTYTTLGTSGGSANTYTATPSPAIGAYTAGQEFVIKFHAINTGASTLNTSAKGARDLKKWDGAGAKVALEAGDIQIQHYKLFDDGTDIVVLNSVQASESAPGAVELATAAEIATGTDLSKVVTVANQSWVKISSATASSSSSIDFTDLSNTYIAYKVYITDYIPVTDGTNLYMRTSADNGSSYAAGASDYAWVMKSAIMNTGASTGATGDDADSEISFQNSSGTDTNEKADFIVDIINPSSSQYTTAMITMYIENLAGDIYYQNGSGVRLAASSTDAIRFLSSSGNIASGTFTLYGLKA